MGLYNASEGQSISSLMAKSSTTFKKGHKPLYFPIIHGDCFSPEYNSWYAMKRRCTNFNHCAYKWYGGRGIKFCKRWSNYVNFLNDMGRKPGKEYTLDRMNVNGNYTPSNCRWATISQQAHNKRELNGKTSL